MNNNLLKKFTRVKVKNNQEGVIREYAYNDKDDIIGYYVSIRGELNFINFDEIVSSGTIDSDYMHNNYNCGHAIISQNGDLLDANINIDDEGKD